MDLDVSTEGSSEDESTSKPHRLRTRKAAHSSCTDAPRPKKKRVDQNENLSVEEIYKQHSSAKAKCTSLETIYEFPKNSRDPAKSLMSTVRSRRSCFLSDFYNPSKSKVKARKERAKRLKRRGVKVPTGSSVTLEQLQAVLGSISEDEENEQVLNSSIKMNLTVNTGVNMYTPKTVVLRPDRDKQDVPLVEGPYILPDLSYQNNTPAPPPMTEEELYEKTKSIFEEPGDECVKTTKRKGRRSGCGRDLMPTLLFSCEGRQQNSASVALLSDSNLLAASTMAAIVEESGGKKEAPKSMLFEDPLASQEDRKVSVSPVTSKDIISQNVGEKLTSDHIETSLRENQVQSILCNFNSGSGIQNNDFPCGSKVHPSRKESCSFTGACVTDKNKKRSKRRVSGIEKALYSSYSTHSPVISEAVDEESNSSKLDESSNDSLRVGFETKLDLNSSFVYDNDSTSAKRGTLKRKSESDTISPLAARLQTLAVRDTRGSLSSGPGGENDIPGDVLQRKIIQGRRRSIRLIMAATAPSISKDVNHLTVCQDDEHEVHCQSEAVNSVTVDEDESVVKAPTVAQSVVASDSCSKSKPKITSSKPRKQSGKSVTGKSIPKNKLDRYKSTSKKTNQDPIVGVPGQCSSDNPSDVQEKFSEENTALTFEAASKGNVRCIIDHCQSPNSSSSYKLGSEEKYRMVKTNAVEDSSRGAKRRGRRNISCLSDGFNALSVSSRGCNVPVTSDGMLSEDPSAVSDHFVNGKKSQTLSAPVQSPSTEAGVEEAFSSEGSAAACPVGPCTFGNITEHLNHVLLSNEELDIDEAVPIPDDCEVNNLLQSSIITRFCGSSSGAKETKQTEVAIEHVLPKQGVKRGSVACDGIVHGQKLLGCNSNVSDFQQGSREKSSMHEVVKSKHTSEGLGCSAHSGSLQTAVALGQSPVKQTKKLKVMLRNLNEECLFDLPSPSTDRKIFQSSPKSVPGSGPPGSSDSTQVSALKPSANSESLLDQNLAASSRELKSHADNPATSVDPPTAHQTPYSCTSAAHPSSVLKLDGDSPILSAMFNSAVGVRVGRVFSNSKLDKSNKLTSRNIIEKFNVYQS